MPARRSANKGLRGFYIPAYCGLGLSALAFLTVAFRPPWPIDETRYLSVAWEMWREGSFWVPKLNGLPYSHKPPLLFWLIHLGWAIFGVNEWWPRLLSFFFGFVNLLLIRRLIYSVYGREDLKDLASLILFGHLIFLFFSSVVMFDMFLFLFVSMAYLSLLGLHSRKRNLVYLGLSMGLGVLTKGPVLFLHILPISFLLPWIFALRKGELLLFYKRLILAFSLGVAISVSWALPASILGGEAYRNELLWGQSVGRMAKSFAHKGPWWFYLLNTPLILLPWTFALFKWARAIRDLFSERGTLLCAILFGLEVVIFSMISGKQIFYILPVILPSSMILAHAVSKRPLSQLEMGLTWALFFILGIWMAFGPYLAERFVGLPLSFRRIPPYWGIALAVLSLLFFLVSPKRSIGQVFWISSASWICFFLLLFGPVRTIKTEFDLKRASEQISILEAKGYEIHHVNKYHGEYHFLGRLKNPFKEIDETRVGDVLRDSKAALVWVTKDASKVPREHILYYQAYAGKHLYLLVRSGK
ncbi:MAG: ArnT family glycosyltransferase [Desulfatiglandales bacterium]